jgi:uncharacterized protein YneF (UPF0154 family)
MNSVITIIVTVICFIISIPIGGWLARRQLCRDWTLDQEIQWWIDFISRRR